MTKEWKNLRVQERVHRGGTAGAPRKEIETEIDENEARRRGESEARGCKVHTIRNRDTSQPTPDDGHDDEAAFSEE